MKISPIIILLFFSSIIGFNSQYNFIFSQQVQQEWVARYFGTGSTSNLNSSVVLDKLGNIYVGGVTHTASNGDDYLVIKYSSSGNQQWIRTYNGPGNNQDFITSIALDDSDNVYVTGTSVGAEFDFATIKYNSSGIQKWVSRYIGPNDAEGGGTEIAYDNPGIIYVLGNSGLITNGSDAILIKYNAQTGDTVWVRRFHETGFWGNYEEQGYSICLGHHGDEYITGSSYWNHGPPFEDFLTLKYDSEGTLIWVKKYNGIGNSVDIGRAVYLDNTGNVIVTGYTTDNNYNVAYGTIKYSPAGVQEWITTYTGPNQTHYDNYAVGIVADVQGNIFVTGSSFGNNETDYTTIRYNEDGVQQWVSIYNGTGNGSDDVYGITIDDSSNVFITGRSLNTNMNFDITTIKYNINGNQQWVMRYSGIPSDYQPIVVDNYYNVYVVGRDSLEAAIIIKYSQPIGIKKISNSFPEKFSLSQNYPNPFNPRTNFRFEIPKESYTKLIVYDMIGREVGILVNEKLQPGKYEMEWDAGNYASGVYFYKFISGDYTDTKKMVLMK